MKLERASGALALALGICLAAAPARAQEGGDETGRWHFQLTPYVWAAGLEGRIAPSSRLPAIQTSKSFGDLLQDLDVGLFVNGFARRDRLVVNVDLSYLAASRGGHYRLGPVRLRGDASVRQFSTTLSAGYRAVAQEGLSLDLLAGVRIWDVKGDADASLASVPIVSTGTRFTWADPILAARLNWRLAPRLTALAYADIGGFGAGARFTWQALGTLNYQATENVYLSAGYRHLAVDYRDGGRRLDVGLSGPLVGVTWRF